MDQTRRPPGLLHQVGGRPGPDGGPVCRPVVTGCAHAVRYSAGYPVLGAHLGVLLETPGRQQHAPAGPDTHRAAVPGRHRPDHLAVGDDHVDEFGIAVQSHIPEPADCGQEPSDQGASADQQVGSGGAQPVVVQRATHQPGVQPQCITGQRGGDDMPHSIQTCLRRGAEVVRPRQHGELEVLVGLQIVDESGTATDVGFLQFPGCAVTDDRVEVGQRLLDGVVAAGPAENGVARKPHPAAAGVGGGAAEFVGCLQQSHRQAFPGRGVRPGEAAAGARDYHVDRLVEVVRSAVIRFAVNR